MELSTKYNPLEVEDKWYSFWMNQGFFSNTPDHREPYCIVIPPPNVTGVLHMGHMLNNTIQDILARRQRMLGKNVVWVPGTDHASIATEAKVVDKLRKDGIEKSSLTREEFLKHAWEWTHKHGGIILEQLKKLGASCDWNRTCFTLDDERYESVIDVFIDLYKKGKIYRGVRMVNWDPKAKTAVSDEEVIYREVESKLYYIKYPIEGSVKEFVTIATTRPETILGDTAVCVNPADERFKHLKGKKVLIPLINRSIPIIEDSYVDMEFGTGCLKITPAHDVNDYEIGIRHNLPSIDIFNDNGTLNPKAQIYVGEDRFVVREKIEKQLKEQGYLLKIENYTNKIGFSERTDAVIEPKLSMQWFLKMKEISQPALEAVMTDEIKLHPPKFKNTYKHWMENVKDWCISRQLWWGHRIPVYYINGTNDYVCAKTIEEALLLAKQKANNQALTFSDLKQDEDVLDTWFSSWLWPIAVFDGIRNPNSPDLKYYYPTNDLVTAPEILFFWVARMIIAGYEYQNAKPFGNVYLTGIVRDSLHRKMSKQLGNSPDPLELIRKYGADGVRVGMLLCSPAGNDLLFDESLPEQGRNFNNKIWNAYRLVTQWKTDSNIPQPKYAAQAVEWFDARLKEAIVSLSSDFEAYRLNEALMAVYKLFWDDFASWYLEIIKPSFGKPIDNETYKATINFFETLLLILHPFIPFITEELWQNIRERKPGESIMVTLLPKASQYNQEIINQFDVVKEVVTTIRKIRSEKNISPKELLELHVKTNNGESTVPFVEVLKKITNLSGLKVVNDKIEGASAFIVRTTEYFVPLGNLINKEEELIKLQKELEYQKGFLVSVMNKLNNEKFIAKAKAEIIELENKKKTEAESKIKNIEEQIATLS